MGTMTIFFKKELASLKEKTGLNQFENMKLEANWKEKANSMVEQMVQETLRPPMDMIREDVIQRVLRDAMMSDDKFIGWNPKWVRAALKRFWDVNGGRILEAVQRKEQEDYKPIERTPEELARIDAYAKQYLEELSKIGSPQKDYSFTEEKRKRSIIQHNSGHQPMYNSIQSMEEREKHLRELSERTYRERHPKAKDEEVAAFMASIPSTLHWMEGRTKRK